MLQAFRSNLPYTLITEYHQSNNILEMQLDGQKTLKVSWLAACKFCKFAEKLTVFTEKPSHFYSYVLPASIFFSGVLSSHGVKLSEEYLNKNIDPIRPIQKGLNFLCRGVVEIGKMSHRFLGQTDRICNITDFVYAIACIRFGSTTVGALELCKLLLISLKRRSYLPNRIEKFINHMHIPFSIINTLNIRNTLSRRLNLISNVDSIITLFLKYVKPIPKQVFNLINEKYKCQQLSRSVDEWKMIFLKVNPYHFYSPRIEELLNPELEIDLTHIDSDELFDRLNNKIRERNIPTDGITEALEEFKICAREGKVSGKVPNNIELFKKLIKAFVQSIINDEVNFQAKLNDLIEVNENCQAGWTKDIETLLAPNTNDIEWMVHHLLAKRRGAILKQFLQGIPKLNSLGGSLNTHLNTTLQATLWHKYRTYEGELEMQLNPPSALILLMLKWCIKEDSSRFSTINLFYAGACFAEYFYSSFFKCNVVQEFYIEHANIHLNMIDKEKIISTIYEAMKPEKVITADHKVELNRTISLDALRNWIVDFQNKTSLLLDKDTGIYNTTYICIEPIYQQIYLTRKGVELLLWDLGILEIPVY